jgi:archaellum component FlaC
MAEQEAKTDQALRALEDRLTTHLDSRYDRLQKENQEAREKLSSELGSKVAELRGQVHELNLLVEELNGDIVSGLEKLSDEIQVVSDDIESRVDFRVEDTATNFKAELEDFILEELKDVEEAVKGSLSRANVSIDFQD